MDRSKQAKATNPAKGGARITKVPKARVPKVLKPKLPKAPKATKPKVSKNAKMPDAATSNQNTADMPEFPIKDEVDSEDELFVQPESSSSQPIDPLTPPIDDETEIRLALNALEDNRTRVARKEQCAAVGMTAVAELKKLLQRNQDSFRQGPGFVEQCDEILDMGKLPRILVGVLGYTGAGKSSLINALIEQETIVPCNSMRASTSVAVEIAYNQSNDARNAFRAEVEFVTAHEWMSEAGILFGDIKNRPETESLAQNSNTDAGLAFSKLSAVYPGVSIAKLVEMKWAEVEKVRDLTEYLGQSISIEEPTAAKFSEAVHPYIDSSNKGTGKEFSCWPLVRGVKVFLKSDMLKHGLVLVDLPGLGDSNSGRTAVAENYIKKLRHCWVVADIVRAIDDRVASELMSRSFKRALLMDGRYHENFVTFIMTKTDQVTTHEVIDSLHLASSVLKEEVQQEAQLEEELAALKEQIHDIKQTQKRAKKSLKKRTLDETDSTADDLQASERRQTLATELEAANVAETEVNAKFSKVKKAISALKVKMRTVCIRERNRYTANHLQQDFRNGRCELVFEELEEAGQRKVSHNSEVPTTSLTVFCVSSKCHQKMSGRFRRDNSIKGFASIEDTNINQLRSFAEKCTLADRETAVDTILTELNLFKISLELWTENRGTKPQLSPEQRQALKKDVELHFLKMKTATDNFKDSAVTSFRGTIKNHIEAHLVTAVIKGCAQARLLVDEMDIHVLTWKAICRRDGGRYKTGKKVQYHWQEEFLVAYINSLTFKWNDVFQNRIPRQNGKFAAKIIESLRGFQKDVHASVTRINGKYHLLHCALKQVPILEDQIRANVMLALKVGQDTAVEAHGSVGEIVAKHMAPYYTAAKEIRGPGTGKALKKSLEKFISDNSQKMYQGASDVLSEQLKKLRLDLGKQILLAARQSQNKLKKDVMRVINMGGVDENSGKSTATAELRSLVKRGLEKIEEDWLKVVESPDELRAENPFSNIPATTDSDDEGDDDRDSDIESESEDEPEVESEPEFESSDEDNDDPKDADYKK